MDNAKQIIRLTKSIRSSFRISVLKEMSEKDIEFIYSVLWLADEEYRRQNDILKR